MNVSTLKTTIYHHQQPFCFRLFEFYQTKVEKTLGVIGLFFNLICLYIFSRPCMHKNVNGHMVKYLLIKSAGYAGRLDAVERLYSQMTHIGPTPTAITFVHLFSISRSFYALHFLQRFFFLVAFFFTKVISSTKCVAPAYLSMIQST